MSKYDSHFEYEAFEYDDNSRQAHRNVRPAKKNKDNGRSPAHLADIKKMDDGTAFWVPTYVQHLDPKHHERQWVIDSVGGFYRNSMITDVTRLVKGGKEANVYCCTAHEATGHTLLAAKLYRPRMLRHLKNDALYKMGRMLRDQDGKELRGRRERTALQKKTRFGQDLDFMQWIGTEFRTQTQLYAAGADVPQPIAQEGNALLMAFIGDEYGAAPTLSEVRIEPEAARPLFNRVLHNIRLMLDLGYVHGDLSAYNILYWNGRITIIDFPQLVNVEKNPYAYELLRRDVTRVCDYFQRFGLGQQPGILAEKLWTGHTDSAAIAAKWEAAVDVAENEAWEE